MLLQTCAAGYTRQPDMSTSLGVCVQCECNGLTASCSVDTGECIGCMNYTTGTLCYYQFQLTLLFLEDTVVQLSAFEIQQLLFFV